MLLDLHPALLLLLLLDFLLLIGMGGGGGGNATRCRRTGARTEAMGAHGDGRELVCSDKGAGRAAAEGGYAPLGAHGRSPPEAQTAKAALRQQWGSRRPPHPAGPS